MFKFSLTPKKTKLIKTNNIVIKTKLPTKSYLNLMKSLEKVEAQSMHGQIPVLWNKAENFSIFDDTGNKWIDFTSTIFVTNIGHSNKYLKKTLINHINSSLIASYTFINKIRADYILKLLSFSNHKFQRAFLLSSGTETTEVAMKLMRLYGGKFFKSKNYIIAFKGNWHGRTMGAQMMSDNKKQSEWIKNIDKNIIYLDFPYPWIIEKIGIDSYISKQIKYLNDKKISLNEDVCGIMLETFQGWGAIFYPKKFISFIKKLKKGNNILVTFDEMQAGFARTGKPFGFEHYDIKPDIVCCGKGMGGGLPLSGVLSSAKIMNLADKGSMSSTHSANPLACAAGIAVLHEIKKNNLIRKADKLGNYLFLRLTKIKNKYPNKIFSIQGKGLIASIIFDKNDKNYLFNIGSIVEECFYSGLLLVYTGRESIKIGPPLSITYNALKEGLDILEMSIDKKYKKTNN